jgi:hypothetical protein
MKNLRLIILFAIVVGLSYAGELSNEDLREEMLRGHDVIEEKANSKSEGLALQKIDNLIVLKQKEIKSLQTDIAELQTMRQQITGASTEIEEIVIREVMSENKENPLVEELNLIRARRKQSEEELEEIRKLLRE